MGDPKKKRKAYQRPRKSFQKERILKENELKELYGLKNKREFYRAESIVRAKRTTAKKLLALDLETRIIKAKELLDSLKRIGILRGTPTLEDVLVLTPESFLERRLQTLVWRKGLANTSNQARQFITHGHIAVSSNKVDRPSYIVALDEETNISYYKKPMQLENTPHEKVAEEKTNKLKEDFEEVKEETTTPVKEKVVETGA